MSIRNPSCVSRDVRRLQGEVADSYGPGFGILGYINLVLVEEALFVSTLL